MARTRPSWPDHGLGFQVKVLNTFKGVPSLLESRVPTSAPDYPRVPDNPKEESIPETPVQGYLAHKKQRPPRTLQ